MTTPYRLFVACNAQLLRLLSCRRRSKKRSSDQARILCLTAGGLREMVDTLPLLHALQRHFPRAVVAVACEEEAAPVARACPAVKLVLVYQHTPIPWLGRMRNALRFQAFDWVIVATPRYDGRLAVWSRLSNAKIRIGFARRSNKPVPYYTDSVPLPTHPEKVHRIEMLIRLLKPVGLVRTTNRMGDLRLRLPEWSRQVAEEIVGQRPFILADTFMLVNFGVLRHALSEQDVIVLLRRILSTTSMAVGLMAASGDQQTSREIGMVLASPLIATLETLDPIELCALLERAEVVVTGGDNAAHLAATVGTPALVLWREKAFGTTQSRCSHHVFIQAQMKGKPFALDQVWQALEPLLLKKKTDPNSQWDELLQEPASSDYD